MDETRLHELEGRLHAVEIAASELMFALHLMMPDLDTAIRNRLQDKAEEMLATAEPVKLFCAASLQLFAEPPPAPAASERRIEEALRQLLARARSPRPTDAPPPPAGDGTS